MIDDILNEDWSEVDDGFEELDMSILRETHPFELMCQHKDYQPDQRHMLFVYGSMKRGYQNNGRISGNHNNKYLGPVETTNGNLVMGTRQSSKKIIVPMVSRVSEISITPGYNIHGELYDIYGPTLLNIDLAEGFPDIYYRDRVTVFMQGTLVGASIYLYNKDFNLDAEYPSVVTYPGNRSCGKSQKFVREEYES